MKDLRSNRRNTQPVPAMAQVRRAARADSGTHARIEKAPRTASKNTLGAARRPDRVLLRIRGKHVCIPIRAPLPNVTMHVIQPRGIRLLRSYVVSLPLRTRGVKLKRAIVAILVNAMAVSSPAGELPLGLGRQRELQIR